MVKKYYVVVEDDSKILCFRWSDRYEEYYILYLDENNVIEGLEEALFESEHGATDWIHDLQNHYFDKDSEIDVHDLSVKELTLDLKYQLNDLK